MRLVASVARTHLRANERASFAGSLLDEASDMREMSRIEGLCVKDDAKKNRKWAEGFLFATQGPYLVATAPSGQPLSYTRREGGTKWRIQLLLSTMTETS